MTENEILEFREKFKRIVFLKSDIKTIETIIRAYSAKDNDGNYKQAILTAIEKKRLKKTEFEALLGGIQYETWLSFSKILSKVQNSQRAARTEINKAFWENKVQQLKFNF